MGTKIKSIVFLHIPKTGGVSIRTYLYSLYKNSDIYNLYKKSHIDSFATKYVGQKLILGHFTFSEKILPCINIPFNSFTFLRNPIDRVISQYNHLLRSEDEMHKKLVAEYSNIEKFSGLHGWGSNTQTYFLSSLYDFSRSDEMLNSAKKNLKEKISVIGIVEKFDDSLVCLQHNLDLPIIPNLKLNVSQNQVIKKHLSDMQIQVIKQNNLLDIALYEYGLELFNEQVKNIPFFKIKKYKNKLFNNIRNRK